jgi:hypothetical protein
LERFFAFEWARRRSLARSLSLSLSLDLSTTLFFPFRETSPPALKRRDKTHTKRIPSSSCNQNNQQDRALSLFDQEQQQQREEKKMKSLAVAVFLSLSLSFAAAAEISKPESGEQPACACHDVDPRSDFWAPFVPEQDMPCA